MMKLTPIQFSNLLWIFAAAIGLTLSSCESDPLLAPQSQVPEETGSYGNTNLPVSRTNNTEKAVNAGQNNDSGGNLYRKTNPKLF